MTFRTKGMMGTGVVLVAGLAYWAIVITRHGFSAREKPSAVEEFLARHARRLATPAGAKDLKNPYPDTSESLPNARSHWVEHCAGCHALDGSGNTRIGRNLYPKDPDLRDAKTQERGDGELYYIISNGIRFTGMPASGDDDSPEEIWQLVSFIRRVPTLPTDELKIMEQLAAGEAGEGTVRSQPHQH